MRSDTAVSPSDAHAVRFIDFAIRAWREGRYVQVIAHSTPAGAMRQPVAVRLGEFDANEYRIAYDAPHSHAAAVGRDLARMLLPHEVWRLLGESLAAISSHPNLGLRIRLCLDDDLIDLPWEFLYRPDVDATAAQSGFLLTDGRISLIREAPSVVTLLPANSNKQRALFIGTMWDDGSDRWGVRSEFTSLKAAMHPVDDLLQFEFVSANNGAGVDAALSVGCDVLHYAGHVDITDGGGTLTQLARAAALHEPDLLFGHQATPATTRQGALEAAQHSAPWSSSDVLANRLAGAKTRLAVFNACNSGLWPFMRPLMRAGIPAAIGVQGLVSNIAALNFTEKFYQSLAVGLSLDEALTYARLYLLQPGRAGCPCDWGRFMAYVPADSAVIFPRPMITVIRERQQELRVGRNQALKATLAIAAELDGQGVSRVLSEVASRSVLILGRFTASRKPVLNLLRQDLSTSPNRYIPILFGFDGPPDRTMIESVLRFAAVSRFVIADLSDPKWVLAELQQIVLSLRSVPVVPIIHESQREDEVIAHFASYSSVHPVIRYRDSLHLHAILDTEVLSAAEVMYGDMKPRAVFT